MNLIGFILNAMHVIILLFPIIIFFLPRKWFKKSFKYIMIVYLLVPLHWVFFDNQCLLSIITKKYGYKQSQVKSMGNSSFSETYFKWFYKPPMYLFGWKWPKDIELISNVHWIINFILLWYYAFFINKN